MPTNDPAKPFTWPPSMTRGCRRGSDPMYSDPARLARQAEERKRREAEQFARERYFNRKANQ